MLHSRIKEYRTTATLAVKVALVTGSGGLGRAVAVMVARHGSLDVPVDAAGSMTSKAIAELEPDDWTATLGVDLIGPFFHIGRMPRRGRAGPLPRLRRCHLDDAAFINGASITIDGARMARL